MKKKILTLSLVLVMVSCALIILSGCGVELTDPQNIKYNGTTISWDSVENATGYTVSINGGTAWPVSNTSYPYNAKGQEFTVAITAVSEAKKLVESGTTTMTFRPLDKVENVKVDGDGVFTWDPVNFASGYKMRLDGVEVDEVIPGTTYSNLPAGNHTVQFKPIVEADPSYFAVWSDAVSVNVLGKVENIQYSNGTLSWGYVSGAQQYQVIVNGIVVEESLAATSMFYDSENRNFEVTVKALGNGTTTCNGAMSDVKSFIYLDTITDLRVEDGIAVWSEINGADGYKIKINGSTVNETLTEPKYDRLYANQSIDIQVMPVSNDTTYFSDWSSVKSVFILAAPTLQWNNYELDGTANSNIFWDSIANAAGYSVKVTYPDGRVETKATTEVSFRESYLEAGTYTVQVKATADSVTSNFYDSQYSIPLTVTRLTAPKAVDKNFITSNPDRVADGFTVTFTNVNGASEYALFMDGHQVQKSINAQFSVSDLVDTGVMGEQTLNFSVQSIGTVKNTASGTHAILSSLSSESLSFEIKVLSVPTNVDISGYTLTYTSVDQSYGYSISVAGNSYTSNSTSYDLSLLEAGNYEVKVCARGNGTNVLASNYTPAINVHRLDAPTNVKISTADSAEGLISFDDVMYAQGYYIVYNNDGNALPISKMTNVKSYITEQGTTVYLTASANYFNDDRTIYYMTSRPSTTYNFIKLAAPTFGQAPFTNSQLVWNAPANVNSAVYTPTYEVYNIDGDAYTGEKNGTSMDISSLDGGKSYTFSVKAIGDGTRYINSDVSTQQATIYKLATPEIRRENGQYVWNGVVDAVSYSLYIDGKLVDAEYHVSGNTYAYTPYFKDHKEYTIELIAKGDGGYTSVDSAKCVLVQKTAQLQKPDYSVSYSEEEFSDSGKIVLTITEPSPYAKGYSYTIGGDTQTSSELSFSLNPNAVGAINTSVYALGGNFDEEGVYYIDSQAQGGSRYTITLLASPDVSSFKITTDGKMTWTNIGSAIKYELQISLNGGDYETVIVNDPMYIIENYASVNSVSVIVKAIGDGNRIITSKEVEYSKVK